MNTYESPEIEVTTLDKQDVVSLSTGDTPFIEFEW